MAINVTDYKRELQKALKDKNLVTSAFTINDLFVEQQRINIPQQIEKHRKIFNELKSNYKTYYTSQLALDKKDAYLKWYEETFLDENAYSNYVQETLDINKNNKEELLDIFNTTDYGKAVRDLVNDKKDYLVYDTFSKIDRTGVLGAIYESALVSIGADVNDKLLFTCTYGVTSDSEFYQEMINSEVFKEKDQDYKDLVYFICKINEKLRDRREQDSKEPYIKYEVIQLPLEYGEKATITDTPLINKMAITPLENNLTFNDRDTYRQLALLNKYDFSVDDKTTQQSQEEINKLTELDRFVLDTIVVDFYYKLNKKEFSDRQLANWYTQKGGKVTPSENIQREINNSIEKLQHIYIDIDYKSVQEFKKNKHVKVKRHNPLLWLESLEVKDDTTSNYYRILDTPFYFTYLKQTNSTMITYDRELLYLDINGVDKSLANQNLKHYLIRRIAPLKEYPNEIYISVSDIYNEQNATAKYYPKINNLKKAKQRARERTEIMLNELKREYNFTYMQNNEGKTIKGYYIKPKKR